MNSIFKNRINTKLFIQIWDETVYQHFNISLGSWEILLTKENDLNNIALLL